MRNETGIDILASELKGEKYDEACKRVFGNKEIIAPILNMVVPEYADCTVEDVIRYIEADSISSDDSVDDVPIGIEGMPTEFSSVSEKLVTFDTHFKALNPKLTSEQVTISLHIDVEAQNDYRPHNPSYPIVKRGIYYAAREVGRQLGTLTGISDYDKLEKVYSIWICNENIPKELQNTVSRYDIKRTDVIGRVDEPEEEYDLMSVVIVRRGAEVEEAGIFDYLNGIFKSDLKKISQYVDVTDNEKIKKEVEAMPGMGATLIQKGIQQGIQQGIDQGIEQGVNSSVQKLAEYYMQQDESLSKEKAMEMASAILK